jgi:hypothetical protein
VISVSCNQDTYQDIKIYPNPALNSLTIEKLGDSGLINYNIYGAQGQLLKNGTFVDKVSLDIVDLPSGIYFVKLEIVSEDDGSNYLIRKIIKE